MLATLTHEGRRTSFERLQQRLGLQDPDQARRSGVAVYLYLFDLLHLEGRDTTSLALRDRKRLLKRTLSFEGHIRFTPHRARSGERFLEEACRKGWEGLIAKRAGAPYRHHRSRDWLKLKCGNRQELVIGGYTDPQGSRTGRTSPFASAPRVKGVHWVSPRLVGEVGFTEWTREGRLRHPRFLGLRSDKSARQVRRERPQPAAV